MAENVNKFLEQYLENRIATKLLDTKDANDLFGKVNTQSQDFMVNRLDIVPRIKTDQLKLQYAAHSPYSGVMRMSVPGVRVPMFQGGEMKTIEYKMAFFHGGYEFTAEELHRIAQAEKNKSINIGGEVDALVSGIGNVFLTKMQRLKYHKDLALEIAFWTGFKGNKLLYKQGDGEHLINTKEGIPTVNSVFQTPTSVQDLGTLAGVFQWGDVVGSAANPVVDLENWIWSMQKSSGGLKIKKIFMNTQTALAMRRTPIFANGLVYTMPEITTGGFIHPNKLFTMTGASFMKSGNMDNLFEVYDGSFYDFNTNTEYKFIEDGEIFFMFEGDQSPIELAFGPNHTRSYQGEMINSPMEYQYDIGDYTFFKKDSTSMTTAVIHTSTCDVLFRNGRALGKVKVF